MQQDQKLLNRTHLGLGGKKKGDSNAKDKAHPESRVTSSLMGILSDTGRHWKCGKEGKVLMEKRNGWKIQRRKEQGLCRE